MQKKYAGNQENNELASEYIFSLFPATFHHVDFPQ